MYTDFLSFCQGLIQIRNNSGIRQIEQSVSFAKSKLNEQNSGQYILITPRTVCKVRFAHPTMTQDNLKCPGGDKQISSCFVLYFKGTKQRSRFDFVRNTSVETIRTITRFSKVWSDEL